MINVCAKCALGSIPGVDSSLRKVALKNPGFRDRIVYVHRNPGLCTYANARKAKDRAALEALAKKHNVWWRRIKRRLWPR